MKATLIAKIIFLKYKCSHARFLQKEEKSPVPVVEHPYLYCGFNHVINVVFIISFVLGHVLPFTIDEDKYDFCVTGPVDCELSDGCYI